ncbi:MAG: hypothetical protein ABSD13_16405 [Candidatus Korobacteraceae bacterium]|jgi:hypothetical protein
MNPPTAQLVAPQAGPGELDALLSAISAAIEALVAWDIAAFDSAVERQRSICDRLASLRCPTSAAVSRCGSLPAPAGSSPALPYSPAAAATARKVRELNRVYDRLLQHSIHWTRTIHSILEAGGHSFPGRASVHFRG